MIRASLAVLIAALPVPLAAQSTTPLFAADAPIRIELRGPISTIAKGSRYKPVPHAAQLSLSGAGERHAVMLTARGITRLKRETCQFPPLRVEFGAAPAAPSLFSKQRRLKLVTHCRPAEGFQQHVLLEYAAYRLYNLLTPASFRARLATIDYVDDNGTALISRVGFFLEDKDDIGRRVGLRSAAVADSIASGRLDSSAAARFALFQYMIGNLDWSMRAGPKGEGCCHNSRLFAAPGAPADGANLVTIPYDFDFSGLVDAPYAVPPEGKSVSTVRQRLYQGFCRHNGEALAAAVEFRSKHAALLAELARVPGLDERSRRKATAYLEGFFADIATDERVSDNVLTRCVAPLKRPG